MWIILLIGVRGSSRDVMANGCHTIFLFPHHNVTGLIIFWVNKAARAFDMAELVNVDTALCGVLVYINADTALPADVILLIKKNSAPNTLRPFLSAISRLTDEGIKRMQELEIPVFISISHAVKFGMNREKSIS